MKTKIFWIILVIVIIGTVIAGCLIFLNKSKKSSETEVTEIPEDNEVLPLACQNAINDYPEWTTQSGDLVVYEKADKSFYFRNSPEEAAALIESPSKDSGTLLDMDFIDKNKFIYTIEDQGLKIGSFEFGLQGVKNQIIYEIDEPVSFADVSPLGEREFIIFYISDSKAHLKYIDLEKSQEETIGDNLESEEAKISLSPKASYFYLWQGNYLGVFDLSNKKLVYDSQSISSLVWLGDSYLLISDSQGALLYDLKNSQKEKIAKITSSANLHFNPNLGGVIAYSSQSESKIVKCQNWEILGNLQKGEIKTLASEKTAIILLANSPAFWRFLNNDWNVKLADDVSIFTTVWQRY